MNLDSQEWTLISSSACNNEGYELDWPIMLEPVTGEVVCRLAR